MHLLRFSILGLWIALAASGCLTGAGTGAATGGSSIGLPSGDLGDKPGSGTLFAAKGAGGSDTLPPRSDLTDGLQDGDIVFDHFRLFLSPKPYNTQEMNETILDPVPAKDVLNLVFLVQAGMTLKSAGAGENPIAWSGYLAGPWLRIVKTPAGGGTPAVFDQFGQLIETDAAADHTGYNGAIKDLPVSEGDHIAIYVFHKENPAGTSVENAFVKPPEDLAAFLSDASSHLVRSFTIGRPSPGPEGIRIMRPEGLPFRDELLIAPK